MNHQELIATASRDEWTLECDKKMLDMMQNIASKIENRAASTRGKMNTMLLGLDETKVKMSNLTRIHDVKNAVFCENLITDDHLEAVAEVPKTDAVSRQPSTQVAIENGLRLMENCFERHRVNLDPSRSRSETTLVYRPVDKFYSSLPYLIGSDKWKEKWHMGLIEEDKVSQTGSSYAESVESNATQNVEPSLMASTDSLAKSSSSIGEQMVINNPTAVMGGLFDEVYDEPKDTQPSTSSSSSFFRPQPAERKIVNLFDDEPPELDDDAAYARKPVNLFEDDYESVASLPIEDRGERAAPLQPPPPVDLFNENEFDDFIKRMENRNAQPSETDGSSVKERAASGVQRDMKMIADEIKQVQLKRRSDDGGEVKTQPKVTKEPAAPVKAQPAAVKTPTMPVKPESVPQQQQQPAVVVVKQRPKITNLFDDDDDESEDFFDEIMKQKTAKPAEVNPMPPRSEPAKIIPELKKKITNLFDDEDEEDAFEDIFSKKSIKVSTPKVIEDKRKEADTSEKKKGVSAVKLFDDDRVKASEKKPSSSLFDDEPKPKISSSLFDDTPPPPEQLSEPSSLKKSLESPPRSSDNDRMETEESRGYQTPTLSHPSASIDKSASQLAGKNDSDTRKIILFDDDNDDGDFFIKRDTKMNTSRDTKITSTHESSKIESGRNESPNIESNSVETDQTVSVESEQRSKIEINRGDEQQSVEAEDPVPNTTMSEKIATSDDFNRSVPFLDDEPPDDEETWETEESNYEVPEAKPFKEIFNQSKSSYQMPLFDDIPPDDEDFSAPPIPAFDEYEDDDDEDEPTLVSDLPVVGDEKSIAETPADPFVESIRESIEKNAFDDQWSDFKEKIKAKTEIVEEKLPQRNESPPKSTPPRGDSIDESDRSVSNIKSKLDLFTKSQETTPSVSQSEPKKLPGKLNTSLKINVSALMPGARLPTMPKKEEASVEEKEESSRSENKPAPPSNSENSNLLNNEATKSRAKIQVKRRPSTRKGRRTIYEKTLSQNLDENEEQNDEQEEEEEKSKHSVDKADKLAPRVVDPRSSNLSIGDNDKAHNKTTHGEAKKPSDFFSDEPPPLDVAGSSGGAQIVVTNKIPVFYDDEDETKKLLEEQKQRQSEKKAASVAAALFDDVDDDIFGGRSATKASEPEPKSRTLLGNESDSEDIFKSASVKKNSLQPKKQIAKSLFGDDDVDDDDLFGKSKGNKEAKSVKLSDSKSEKQGSLIFAKSKKQQPKQSLFGDSDEEEDDDDLFSSKPKNAPNKSSSAAAAIKSTAAPAKKATVSKVVNDPLKDLMNN